MSRQRSTSGASGPSFRSRAHSPQTTPRATKSCSTRTWAPSSRRCPEFPEPQRPETPNNPGRFNRVREVACSRSAGIWMYLYIQRRTREVGALLPELYLHGLSTGDFELALRGLLGEAAPLSASSIQRLKTEWQTRYEAWRQRDVSELELVYVWADGLYVKAGLEDTKAALLG